MDDTKPANETNEPGLNKIDLSQLQDFTFGTQWTEVKNLPGGPRRDDRRERRDDGGRGAPPRDRRAFRKPAVGPTGAGGGGGPGPSGGAGGGGEPAMRERPQGEGFRGGPRRDFRGGGDRGERRDFRGGDRRDGQPMERGPYISPYFTMTCYPEDAGFAAMVKAVRASCRTFQLFEITKAVLEKNERFVLVIQRKTERGGAPEAREGENPAAPARAEKPAPLFMSVPDHLPFETEEAALHHVLTNHLGTFFSTQDVEIDPPKGNFPIINKCGVTGELLGPPNYHKYQQILQQHHATRLGRMSFDRFRDSIQSVREPEVVQQWLEKMKKATRYTWIYGQKPAAPKAAAIEPGAETPPTEASAASAPAEAPTAEATAPDAAPVPPATEANGATESAPAAVPAAAPEPPASAPATSPSFDGLEEAKAYLLATAKEKAVRAVENVRFHGRLIEKLPPGEIRRAVEGHVERQRRFPLDTANALRGRLRREGFTIFKKGSRGVSYVCAVKRRFRVPGQVFSETITALIDFIEKNPLVHVKDLPKQLLGIELPAAVPAAASGEGQVPPPAPAPALLPEQADKIRKMSNDLRWLVTEGYVTEFSDGKLFAPPPVSPQAQKRPDEHGEEHDPVDFPEAPAAAKPTEAETAGAPPVESGEGPVEAGPAPAEAESAPLEAEPAPVETEPPPTDTSEPAPVSEGVPPTEEAPPKPETPA